MASVFFDILYYTIGNIIVCIFENSELNLLIITAGVYKLRLAEAKFPSCYLCLTYSHIRTALKGHAKVNVALSCPVYVYEP